MKDYTPGEYLNARCEFALESFAPFVAVHVGTQGRVCDTGCATYQGGKCPAYRVLTTDAKAAPAPPGETVRQEADRRGLSINEVRRQRRA